MKYFLTLVLLFSFVAIEAQTPQCLVYHGCGGATVVAYQGDLGWSAITYDFQRFQGGNWVTIHQSTSNYHIVLNGDITVASNYRAVLRNNTTSEERISNGAIVDPAKFNDAVTKPKPIVTFYWGTSVSSGQNYVEVTPGNFGLSGYRSPFTYTIKKKNSFVFDQKISTTGIFFTNNIEANQEYVFTVTDYCGNVDSTGGSFGFAAFGRVTARNCSGASIELSSVANGQNVSHRLPITFGLAPLADSINQFDVPESILGSMNYTYSAGINTGFTAKRYVVRARDAFGVLSNYTVVSTGLETSMPFIRTIGPSAGFCNVSITLDGNYTESGIRRTGDNQPYTFTSGTTITGIRAGFAYELVVKDSCGRISAPLLQEFVAFPPKITNVNVAKTNCSNTLTITATSCTNNPEYRLQLFGEEPGDWQSSNVFTNVPGNSDEYHKVFARDGNSALDSSFVYVPALSANVEINPFNGICGELADILVRDVNSGTPPYLYAISYDGINYTPFSTNNHFTRLLPGTYDVVVKDSCGNIFRSTQESQRQVGDWYYVNETGFKTTCTATTEQAGGFIRVGIQQPNNIYGAITTPYQYELKEITSTNGNSIQYGKVVSMGQTSDTTFIISGLPGGKGYGIFITNKCGDPVTSRNRVVNDYFIPAGTLPEPEIVLNNSNCNQPFFAINNLPNGGNVKIFNGRDTTGAVIHLATASTSTALAGGYYTIQINTPNYNGCSWMQLYERFVNSTDSTSAGTYDVNLGGICKADSSILQLKKYVLGQTPGGTWSGSIPDSNWVNRDSGQFRTIGLASGVYDFTYSIQSICGANKELAFSVPIDLINCGLSASALDVTSAGAALGCKNYAGDEWFDVLDAAGTLRFSINPGNGNTMQSVCWGARYRDVFATPRTIALNNSTVYFASRNFYIEPNQLTVGANPVKVRLYYSNDDIEGLLYHLKNNGFPSATANDLRILKKQAGLGSPIDLEVNVEPGTPLSLYTYITPTVHRLGAGQFASWYFEFEVNSFSELGLVYTTGTLLPVTWWSVTGQLAGGKSFIKWSTATETNTASFTVEHSVDGNYYTPLKNISAAGNSNAIRHYEYVHASPIVGANYYRIKQTDRDGLFTYSKTILLDHSNKELPISLAPNPVRDQLIVWLPASAEGGVLKIFNQVGQLMHLQAVAIGTTQLQVNTSKLTSGMYRLQLLQPGSLQTLPFIKN